MASRAKWALSIFAMAGANGTIACGSFDKYSSLRGRADAAGASGGNGGQIEAGPGRGGSPPRDAQSEDSSFREASDAPDGVPPPGPGDVMDAATLQPFPAQSTCGFHLETEQLNVPPGLAIGTVAHTWRIIDFGCPEIMQDFQFLTPPGATVVGSWRYVASVDPHVVQDNNAQAYPACGQQSVVAGTRALYMPETMRDGLVSVHEWSTDDDTACVIARYQDEAHFYRLCIGFNHLSVWTLTRIDCGTATELERGTLTDTGHIYPGHVLGLELVGHTILPIINGQPAEPRQDPGGYSFGRVGMEAIVLQDANFDDLTIVPY